jgi:hypothetical protein
VTGDRYAAQWTVEAFANQGIAYRQSDRDRSALYLDSLPLFTSGRVRLLDNQRLAYQFASLERRVSRLGRDIVDHPIGGADDLSNAAAGALVIASSASAPVLWRGADLLTNNQPVPWPTRSRSIYVTAATDQRGVFLCYWAKGASLYGGPEILLIDYQQSPLFPGLFRDVGRRLAELASMPVPHPSTTTIPAATMAPMLCTIELAPHAEAAGVEVHHIDGTMLLRQRDALLLACSAWIASGAVKISDLAQARSQALPLPLTELRADADQGAAVDAVLLGLGGALPYALQPIEWREAA